MTDHLWQSRRHRPQAVPGSRLVWTQWVCIQWWSEQAGSTVSKHISYEAYENDGSSSLPKALASLFSHTTVFSLGR